MKRSIRHDRSTWAIFTKPSHRPFFDSFSNHIKEKYPQIEILVVDKKQYFYSGPTMSHAEHALFRSEILLIDIACPSFDHVLHNATRNRLKFILISSDYDLIKSKLMSTNHEFSNTNQYSPNLDEDLFFIISEQELQQSVEVKVAERLLDQAITIGMRQFFLSYAGEDKAFADHIALELSEKSLRVWYAPWEIGVGDSIVDKINEGIKGSAYIGVVLSPSSVDKPWCKAELNAAFHLKLNNKGIYILPILYKECDIPPLFKDMFFADFRQSFDIGMKKLIKAIK